MARRVQRLTAGVRAPSLADLAAERVLQHLAGGAGQRGAHRRLAHDAPLRTAAARGAAAAPHRQPHAAGGRRSWRMPWRAEALSLEDFRAQPPDVLRRGARRRRRRAAARAEALSAARRAVRRSRAPLLIDFGVPPERRARGGAARGTAARRHERSDRAGAGPAPHAAHAPGAGARRDRRAARRACAASWRRAPSAPRLADLRDELRADRRRGSQRVRSRTSCARSMSRSASSWSGWLAPWRGAWRTCRSPGCAPRRCTPSADAVDAFFRGGADRSRDARARSPPEAHEEQIMSQAARAARRRTAAHRTSDALFERACRVIPGGREFAGARLPRRRRHAALHRARRGRTHVSMPTATATSTSWVPGAR